MSALASSIADLMYPDSHEYNINYGTYWSLTSALNNQVCFIVSKYLFGKPGLICIRVPKGMLMDVTRELIIYEEGIVQPCVDRSRNSAQLKPQG